jgi:hypothetical protein
MDDYKKDTLSLAPFAISIPRDTLTKSPRPVLSGYLYKRGEKVELLPARPKTDVNSFIGFSQEELEEEMVYLERKFYLLREVGN